MISIEIFPNPTHNRFTVNLSDNTENNVVNVFDLTGKLVFAGIEKKTKQIEIDLQDQPSGIYVVELKNSEGIYHTKVIKRSSILLS